MEAGTQRHRDGRQFRCRIGMRKIAADGAAVADLRMRDMRQSLADQGKQSGKGRVALQRLVARQRPNSRALPNTVQGLDPVDVDQDRRPSEAKIHCRDQALPAGQEFRLVAMLRLQRQRLL